MTDIDDKDKTRVLPRGTKLDIECVRDPKEAIYRRLIYLFSFLVLSSPVLAFSLYQPSMIRDYLESIVTVLGLMFAFDRVIHYFFFLRMLNNSVRVGETQYPQIYNAVNHACKFLEMTRIPHVFVIDGAGLFEVLLAGWLSRRGTLIFTSRCVDDLAGRPDGSKALMMLLGRQLAHLRLGHFRWWTLADNVGRFSLFLHSAYSRSRHRTADRIGCLVSGSRESGVKGLLCLGVGATLAYETNFDALRNQRDEAEGLLFSRVYEWFQNYPWFLNRVVELYQLPSTIPFQDGDGADDCEKGVGFARSEVNVFFISGDCNLQAVETVGAVVSGDSAKVPVGGGGLGG